jgi:hypothetical protein
MGRDDHGRHRSEALSIPVLAGAACHMVIEGYDDDANREDFDAAVAAFLNLDRETLAAAAPAIFEYYQDVVYWLADATVTKVGPLDGHLTNAAAYARDDLEGVIYHGHGLR